MRYIFLVVIALAGAIGCRARLSADFSRGQDQGALGGAFQILDRTPVVASPGDAISITGTGFSAGIAIEWPTPASVITPNIESAEKATFGVPADAVMGLVTATAKLDGVEQKFSLIVTAKASNSASRTSFAPSALCSGGAYVDVAGQPIVGTLNCAAATPLNCAADGQVGCMANKKFKAAAINGIDAQDIRTGVTIAGVSGALSGGPPACSASGQTNCIATNLRPVVDVTVKLVPGAIKKGVVILGVTGDFPSAIHPLSGGSAGVADLTSAAFDSAIGAATAFEWWRPDGGVQQAVGDDDLDISNLVSTATVFGVTGNLTAAGSYCSDAGQTGCITTSAYRSNKVFRNTADLTIYDNITPPAGVGLDPYDTLEDELVALGGTPPDQPWGAGFASSASYWVDKTADGTCDNLLEDCVYESRMTGLEWSESSTNLNFSAVPAATWPCGNSGCTLTGRNVNVTGGGAYVAGAQMYWHDATKACDLLVHAGRSDWRLPTQKELLQAKIHGLRYLRTTYFNPGAGSLSSTSVVHDGQVSIHYLSSDLNNSAQMNTKREFLCVRP